MKSEGTELLKLAKQQHDPSTDQAALKKNLSAHAAKRSQALHDLISTDPAEALRLALPASLQQNVSSDVSPLVENEQVLTGNLAAVHGDNFNKSGSLVEVDPHFELTTHDGRTIRIHFADGDPDYSYPEPVAIKGMVLGNDMVVTSAHDAKSFQTKPPFTLHTNSQPAAAVLTQTVAPRHQRSGTVAAAADTVPPTVSLTSPTSFYIGSGIVNVTANASDASGVSRVDFSVDNVVVATSATTPYGFSWNTASYPDGQHLLTAQAYDAAGNVGTVTEYVSTDNIPSVAEINVPYDGAVLAVGHNNVYFEAQDDGKPAVSKLELYIDNQLVQTIANAAVSSRYYYDWDSSAALGTHTVFAKSYDPSGHVSTSTPTTVTIGPTAQRRVAIILYKLQNQTETVSPDTVRSLYFTDTPSVAGLYKEMSANKVNIVGKYRADGDVFGPYTLPYNFTPPATYNGPGCDYTTWEQAAHDAAKAAGVDLSNYDVVVNTIVAVPTNCDGSGYGGGPTNRVPWYANFADKNASWNQGVAFFGHELGHSSAHVIDNNIIAHASSYECYDSAGKQTVLSTNCTRSEYGDAFDIMGGDYPHQFNNFHKGDAGWLAPGNTQTVTTSGTYSLYSDSVPSDGVQSLRIPRTYDANGQVHDYFYLEVRSPTTYADNVSPNPNDPTTTLVPYSGIMVRIATDYTNQVNSPLDTQTLLLDMTPGYPAGPCPFGDAYCTWADVGLPPGQSFQDPASGVSFKTVSMGNPATVAITVGQQACTRANPTISINPLGQWGNPGQALSYAVSVTNNDSLACGASNFNLASALPSGFSQSGPASLNVGAGGGVNTANVLITSPTSDPGGYRSFTETASNGSAVTYQSAATANYNVYDTLPPTVSITSPASGATVTATTNISANASDASGITKLDFAIENSIIKTVTTPPYSASWDTTTTANGPRTITVTAYDNSGLSATASITVNVQNALPPPPPPPVTKGILQGKIHTASGVPIPKAKVAITAKGGTSASVISDSTGAYIIGNIIPATYKVTASASGHRSQTATVTITAGQTTLHDFTL